MSDFKNLISTLTPEQRQALLQDLQEQVQQDQSQPATAEQARRQQIRREIAAYSQKTKTK